jgi:hypothetical protein
MFQVDVKAHMAGYFERFALDASGQAAFATAVALTRTAKAGKDEVERQMSSVLDRPNPYTMRAFRLYPATKTNLVATVEFRPTFSTGSDPRDYLAPIVYGGGRKLKAFERALRGKLGASGQGLIPEGYVAVPGAAAKLDAHGNLARGQIVQMLAYFQAFGEQGYRANTTDKRRAALAKGNAKKGQRGVSYFVGRPGNGRLPPGIWQRTDMGALGSAIKPIIIFVKAPKYRVLLDVPAIAERVTRGRFPSEFKRAADQAMRTAIPKRQASLF